MKYEKRQMAIVLAVGALMICSLSGCVNRVSIVGSYDMGGDATTGVETFFPDGTLTWSQPSVSRSGTGTWVLDGTHLTISYTGDTFHEGEVQGNPFSFSVYGPLCHREGDDFCAETVYGTTTFQRRFLGLPFAMLDAYLSTNAKDLDNLGNPALNDASL